MNEVYKRNCPKCDKELFYASQSSYCDVKRRNSVCRSCSYSSDKVKLKRSLSHKGKTSGFKNKEHSEESKNKMSNWHKGKIVSLETKQKLSVRLITQDRKSKMSIFMKSRWQDYDFRKKMIGCSNWKNVKCDKGQLELLEKWNRLGFTFEPNYQIKTTFDLFYIDGYDKAKNVVLEYDSKYHNTLQQKRKDLIREKKIVNVLKPIKFWRYNSETKQFKNIL